MTSDQEKWLKDNSKYSQVRGGHGLVSLTRWADQGYLFSNGLFALDDGNTWFGWSWPKGAIRVGRHYQVA